MHSLQDALCVVAVDRHEVSGVVASDRTAQFALLVQADPNLGRDVSKVREAIHTAVQVRPDRLHLNDAEEQQVHETEDIEGRLLGGEGPHAVALKLVRDGGRGVHGTGSTSPSKSP